MTRDNLIEAMARAAWEASDEPEPWMEMPESMRRDWCSYQRAALATIEASVPGVREAIDAATT